MALNKGFSTDYFDRHLEIQYSTDEKKLVSASDLPGVVGGQGS